MQVQQYVTLFLGIFHEPNYCGTFFLYHYFRYELKTPQFHYEAQKNNTLLANKEHWQSLMDYRNELLQASKEFKNTFHYES